MKTGLILEGGAMRGLFTCGVMDVLMEEGIVFDGAAGISAGAVFGVNYKSKQIGRPRRYNERFCKDPRYCSLKSLITTGDLYGADFCYREVPEKLDVFDKKTFAENEMEFYVGATDIETGKIVYHLCRDGEALDNLWMRASASMPMVSRPVEIDGHVYLDGGIADSIPLEYMESQGYDRNVAVLTQPIDYRKKKNALLPLMRLSLRKYPRTVEAMAKRHIMYNRQTAMIREKEAKGEILVIRPEASLEIARTEKDPQEMERVYQLGRAVASKKLPEVRAFLHQ